ncbi:hypothetical protein PIB30_082412 [Stylosanthes scabra]|uniref:Uncharacterized protein n=1 Tax=Stylosanthes scabra TaxID=79078 RepID=A0ABU6ZQQ4_9FABA|nr:hypothetical protein [Stylosanthes scabra]
MPPNLRGRLKQCKIGAIPQSRFQCNSQKFQVRCPWIKLQQRRMPSNLRVRLKQCKIGAIPQSRFKCKIGVTRCQQQMLAMSGMKQVLLQL